MTQPRHYDLNHTSIWAKLHQHQRATRHMHMRELFAADPERFARFSLSLGPLLMDYSKHRITERTLELLFELAHAARLGDWRQRMRAGERINVSEQRPIICARYQSLRQRMFHGCGSARLTSGFAAELRRQGDC